MKKKREEEEEEEEEDEEEGRRRLKKKRGEEEEEDEEDEEEEEYEEEGRRRGKKKMEEEEDFTRYLPQQSPRLVMMTLCTSYSPLKSTAHHGLPLRNVSAHVSTFPSIALEGTPYTPGCEDCQVVFLEARFTPEFHVIDWQLFVVTVII